MKTMQALGAGIDVSGENGDSDALWRTAVFAEPQAARAEPTGIPLSTRMRAVIDRVRERRRFRAQRRELLEMPEHVLRDLGIGRSQILAVMRCGRID